MDQMQSATFRTPRENPPTSYRGRSSNTENILHPNQTDMNMISIKRKALFWASQEAKQQKKRAGKRCREMCNWDNMAKTKAQHGWYKTKKHLKNLAFMIWCNTTISHRLFLCTPPAVEDYKRLDPTAARGAMQLPFTHKHISTQ